MKLKCVVAFLIILLSITGFALAQVIMPSSSADVQVPLEILSGLIGRYMAMVEEHNNMISQGVAPAAAVRFRLAADIVVSEESADSDLDSVLMGISRMAFWVKANIFSKYPFVKVDFTGDLGNLELLTTDTGAIIVARDEALFSEIPSQGPADPLSYIGGMVNIGEFLPEGLSTIFNLDLVSMGQLQELISSFLLQYLASADMEYGGFEQTPRGMAHVVRLSTADIGAYITLWVLDETWDLYKVELINIQGGSNVSVVIEEIEFSNAVIPDSAFTVDTANLAELPYEELLKTLDMNVLKLALNGNPVAVDLSISSFEVRQDEGIFVISDGMDAEDKESDLIPQIEYRGFDGTWNALSASYIGVAPLGHWNAVFVPTQPGVYDFRVIYVDNTGAVSDPLELIDALKVLAKPPRVITVSPGERGADVLVSARIVVNFDQEMDKVSAEKAFSLASIGGLEVLGSFQWADSTLTFAPSKNLDYNATYRVTIRGSAKSAFGVGLDVDNNGVATGSPKDDLSWWFSTETFTVVSVELKNVKQPFIVGEFVKADVVIKSVSNLSNFEITLSFKPEVLKVLKVEQASFADWRPRPRFISDVDVWRPLIIDEGKGVITIAADNTRTGGVSGAGIIATISFQAFGDGVSPLKLLNVSLFDSQSKGIPFQLQDSEVQVTSFDIWDANQDGVVDIHDFVSILSSKGGNPDVNGDGVVDIHDIVAASGAKAASEWVPVEDKLDNNYPNPFNPETWMPYQLSKSAHVNIYIYSAIGQLVRSLDLGYKSGGRYNTKSTAAYWDGTNDAGERVASGIYYCAIKAGDFFAVRKMMLLE